jgi:hypothetical protein
MGSTRLRFFVPSLFPVLLLIFLSGCATTSYRSHPEFDQRIATIKTPSLLPPDVKVYELSAGGVGELRDDWSRSGKENMLKAVLQAFKEHSLDVTAPSIDKEIEDELEDIQALYRAVSASIITYTYNPASRFPEKVKNFDYSVGPINKVLDKCGADSLVLVYGSDEISSAGRKTLAVVGILAGAVTGVAIVPRSGITAVSASLIDRSGSVLWYNFKGSGGGRDLRDYESCNSIARDVIFDFPGKKGK